MITRTPGFVPQNRALSFSSEVRSQAANAVGMGNCCAQAALLALISTYGGESVLVNGEHYLVFSVASPAVARLLFRLSKQIFQNRPRVDREFSPKLKRKRLFRVWLELGNANFQKLSSLEELKQQVIKRSCCRRSFLRGAFLGCGSMVDPDKAYHLEFSAADSLLDWVEDLLHKEGIQPKRCQKTGQYNETLYLKNSGEIAQLLTIFGAHRAVLKLEEVLLSKELRNSVQRTVNCETANLERTVTTATRQVQEIEMLLDKDILTNLPSELQETAILRVDNPYASLQELALLHDPPKSKSAINHRLRKLHEIARENGMTSSKLTMEKA